jgi:DNA-directed RNA polymerase subunit M/transcription elongation factor TFIIS
MVWTARDLNTTFPSCPLCTSSLLELSDMWGVFYACDECGYETEALEAGLEINGSRQRGLVRQLAVARVAVPL